MTTQISGDTGVSQCQPNSVSQGDLQDNALGAASLPTPGYQKFPSGLMIQWGSSTTLSTGQATITFPEAFTYAPVVVATVGQTPLTAFMFAQVSDIGLTDFRLGSIQHDGTRISVTEVQWTAIGRWK